MYSTLQSVPASDSAPVPVPEPEPDPASGTVRPTTTAIRSLDSFDAYRIALDSARLSRSLAEELGSSLRDQLNRAASSVVLNIAEGFGSYSSGVKRRHYEIARGSATECIAILDLVSGSGSGSGSESGSERTREDARALFTRCAMMLAKLVARFR